MNEQIVKLNAFLNHLKHSANEMLDIISEPNGDYEERFDIKISINGKFIKIHLCAETYNRLEQFINEEIIKEQEWGE
jgi:hypothetical protein